MSHILTYPDIFKNDETYVPIKWDMSDFEKKLLHVLENYEYYKKYVFEAQKIFKDSITNYGNFLHRFKEALDI